MITKGQIKAKVLRLLNRSAKYKGAYTDEKLDDAIEDCMDYISTIQALANEGWNTRFKMFTTVDSQYSVEIPPDWMLINQVRYKVGDSYIPLVYDQNRMGSQSAGDSGNTQFPSRYSVKDNQIFFNPPLGEGGTDFLQVEYAYYPSVVKNDLDTIGVQFDKAMQHFIKFRAASYLAATVSKPIKEWSGMENQWYNQIVSIVHRRNNVQQTIREFDG